MQIVSACNVKAYFPLETICMHCQSLFSFGNNLHEVSKPISFGDDLHAKQYTNILGQIRKLPLNWTEWRLNNDILDRLFTVEP